MIIKTKIAFVAAVLLLSGSAAAEGDAAAGAAIGYSCLGCHGIEGYRNAYPSFRVPKLGGQKATYLEIALRGYRDGMREHPTMVAQSASLTDQQIADVAAFLASFGSEAVDAGGAQVEPFAKAATCNACHGQNGISLAPNWPTLAGQHEEYLVHALNQYRDGSRKDPVMSPMAAPLTDEDVKILAKFYSSLPGLETTLKAD
ncbi:MAG: c-type cytochrome [Woeseiaceae bacterium]|nr:c-type cytochrome [Woeseiaceae bacterium]